MRGWGVRNALAVLNHEVVRAVFGFGGITASPQGTFASEAQSVAGLESAEMQILPAVTARHPSGVHLGVESRMLD